MPSWSPDGSRIAFVANRTEAKVGRAEGDLYLMNADGSGTINLTRHPANDDEPAWSGDGKSLYFLSLRNGPSQLFRLRLDGGSPERMTAHGSHDLMFSSHRNSHIAGPATALEPGAPAIALSLSRL